MYMVRVIAVEQQNENSQWVNITSPPERNYTYGYTPNDLNYTDTELDPPYNLDVNVISPESVNLTWMASSNATQFSVCYAEVIKVNIDCESKEHKFR